MEKFKELINGDTPVLVDFYAQWCGPCKAMGPVLDEYKKRKGNALRIIKIDIDGDVNQDLVREYRIQSVPTLMLFKKGIQLWRQSGAMGIDELDQEMCRLLN